MMYIITRQLMILHHLPPSVTLSLDPFGRSIVNSHYPTCDSRREFGLGPPSQPYPHWHMLCWVLATLFLTISMKVPGTVCIVESWSLLRRRERDSHLDGIGGRLRSQSILVTLCSVVESPRTATLSIFWSVTSDPKVRICHR